MLGGADESGGRGGAEDVLQLGETNYIESEGSGGMGETPRKLAK